MNSEVGGKATRAETLLRYQQHLQRQRDAVAFRMKKLAAKQAELTKKTDTAKERIKKKYEDMKRVLDEDLRITLAQLDTEHEATEKVVEDKMEDCYHLTQELDQLLASISTVVKTQQGNIQQNEERDKRSQVPVTKKLFQSYASDVVLDADTAHPKLIVSPEGDSATYTETWQDVPETPSRFDTTLNVISQGGFSDGRHYWEVEVSGKTYWELGLTYPSIPRQGREEDSWLGRGKESWCVEYFNGDYTAWHGGVRHELPLLAGRQFTRIGVFCTFPGGLVCFLGADTMTPLHCFCAGTFTDSLHQALCPGHDNEGTNWKSLKVCDAKRSPPVL
ncbi:E3 ubiquitin-protein ligase TRIM21 isoform 3-T3 [Menidia menidia]